MRQDYALNARRKRVSEKFKRLSSRLREERFHIHYFKLDVPVRYLNGKDKEYLDTFYKRLLKRETFLKDSIAILAFRGSSYFYIFLFVKNSDSIKKVKYRYGKRFTILHSLYYQYVLNKITQKWMVNGDIHKPIFIFDNYKKIDNNDKRQLELIDSLQYYQDPVKPLEENLFSKILNKLKGISKLSIVVRE